MGDAPQAASYSWFDHTADVGVDLTAPSLEKLFETAATALFDLLVELLPGEPRPHEVQREVWVRGADREELLVRWLSELLYIHDAEGVVFHEFKITEMRDDSVSGRATGEISDPVRHRARTEVKAVTYHQVFVRQEAGSWKARVVFDV